MNNQFVPIWFFFFITISVNIILLGKISSEVSLNKYSLPNLSLNLNLNFYRYIMYFSYDTILFYIFACSCVSTYNMYCKEIISF